MKYFANKILVLILFIYPSIFPLTVGDTVNNVTLRDSSDNQAQIPDLGKKVIAIFYTDPDVANQNDPLADLLKAEKLDKTKYKGVGIGNLSDSWKPDSLIRAVVRKKERKYGSKILTDPEGALRKAWNLGDCNEKSVVIVIGKQKKIHYIKKGALNQNERKIVLELIKKLMEK